MSEVRARLALDVGGANIKAAHSAGAACSAAFALWKAPERLAAEVAAVAGRLPAAEAVTLTMTAELCDCYATKREGVLAVLDAVAEALPGLPIEVWGTDGRFHSIDAIREAPVLAAAANWLALATVAARRVGPERGLLLDVGSTTTDVIPLAGGDVSARGRTDTERLQNGELVYAGVRRTPLCALAASAPLRGVPTGIAAELFATTHDVFLTLREVEEDLRDRDTADGRPSTLEAARDRLARMVGADREGFTEDDAGEMASFFRDVFVDLIVEASHQAFGAGSPKVVVVSGSGEFLARRSAERLGARRIVSLAELWGRAASDAACAWALLELAWA